MKAGTPHILPPFPEGAPKNRLGFAQWLGTQSPERGDQNLGPFFLHLINQIARIWCAQINQEQSRTSLL